VCAGADCAAPVGWTPLIRPPVIIGGMDRLVDLDAVAAELTRRRPEWVAGGLTVGKFTWRDAEAAWPQPIVTDRATVADPESLGLVFGGMGGDEAELVLWCGGWADLHAVLGGEAVTEGPEFAEVAGCVAVADSLARRLLQRAADSLRCQSLGELAT